MARKHTRRARHSRRRTHRGGRGYTTAGAAELKQLAPAMYGGKSGSSSSDSGESINMATRNRNNLTMKNGINMGRRLQVVRSVSTYHNNSKKNNKHPLLDNISHIWSNSTNSTLRTNARPYKPLRANAKSWTPY